MNKLKILVLGANGMLGHTVFNYLNRVFLGQVWGTTRQGNVNTLKLTVESLEDDFEIIAKKLGNINYIINCIGLIKNTTDEKLVLVNTVFPRKLARLSNPYGFKIIHMSTDGVFEELANNVTEDDLPYPPNLYGKSKLLGEQKEENFLTFRASLLGLDPNNHRGLLEWALQAKYINGYTNQLWSGCTTLQFAQLVERIITSNAFDKLRKKSAFFHFSPLKNITKYEILKEFFGVLKKKTKVIPIAAQISINRQLITKYLEDLWYNKFTHDLSQALLELVMFENEKKISLYYRY